MWTVLVYCQPIPKLDQILGTLLFHVHFFKVQLCIFLWLILGSFSSYYLKLTYFWWNLKVLFNCIESVAKGMCQTRQFANHGLWLLICCHLAFPALFLFLSISVTLQAFITTRFVELIYRIFSRGFAAAGMHFDAKFESVLQGFFFLEKLEQRIRMFG